MLLVKAGPGAPLQLQPDFSLSLSPVGLEELSGWLDEIGRVKHMSIAFGDLLPK